MCSSCTNVHSSHAVFILHWPLNDAHPMREGAIIRVVPAVKLLCDCVCVCAMREEITCETRTRMLTDLR